MIRYIPWLLKELFLHHGSLNYAQAYPCTASPVIKFNRQKIGKWNQNQPVQGYLREHYPLRVACGLQCVLQYNPVCIKYLNEVDYPQRQAGNINEPKSVSAKASAPNRPTIAVSTIHKIVCDVIPRITG